MKTIPRIVVALCFILTFGTAFACKSDKMEYDVQSKFPLLVLSGGVGGEVSYDGQGGPLDKMGGPIDCIFLVTDPQREHVVSLTIANGTTRYQTGKLLDHEIGGDESGYVAKLQFSKNPSTDAARLQGAIPKLDLPDDTVIYKAAVELSHMIIERVAGTDKLKMPYWANNTQVELHPRILEYFGVKLDPERNSFHAWKKVGTSGGGSDGGGDNESMVAPFGFSASQQDAYFSIPVVVQ